MPKKVILCVDDEKMVLDSLKAQLKTRFGDQYQYETAEDVAEALEVIDELGQENRKLLMIVSDWLMPGTKGDEFLIQVHRRYPEVVTVLLTGQADEAAVERTRREANLHRCIHKPWSEEELAAAIRSGVNSND